MEESINELRTRYRQEALEAVRKAEQRGYQRGKDEAESSLSTVAEEKNKWKSIAVALGAEQTSHTSSGQLLVHYIMEKAYQRTQELIEPELPSSIPYLRVFVLY
jgi:hypothetical protein